MKCSILLVLVVCSLCHAQNNEFKIYSNGLIYEESTMNRLQKIVDSLNVRFRTCDLSHPYYSLPQGMATLVSLPNKEARKLINDGITLEEYKKRFPRRIEQENIWIIKSRYKSHDNKRFIEYSGLPKGWNREPSITVKDERSNDKTSGWVMDDEGSSAFYLMNMEKTELPFEYARLVQYVDCMIDTTASIYSDGAEGRVYQQVSAGSKAKEFKEWVEKFPNRPIPPDYEKYKNRDHDFASAYSEFNEKYKVWDSLRLAGLDKRMEKGGYWKDFLREAVEESLTDGNSDEQFEFYVSRYLSKTDALNLKRRRRVVGNCSMDSSPRIHAMNICVLSAETAQWDIFLRSHLDIMNDRFDRMSDGSYAWAGRKTYLKELEELDINSIDLLLGICLRVGNVNDNHYWGSIGRIGRALSDASDRAALEERMLKMIKDEKLDPYNRLLIAYLFNNYASEESHENSNADSFKKLAEAMSGVPSYIKEVWGKN